MTLGKHNIGAMAGMSYIESNSDNVNASASGPDILTGYEPNFRYLNYVNSASDTRRSFGNAPSRSANISYYGRLTYNYAITATMFRRTSVLMLMIRLNCPSSPVGDISLRFLLGGPYLMRVSSRIM